MIILGNMLYSWQEKMRSVEEEKGTEIQLVGLFFCNSWYTCSSYRDLISCWSSHCKVPCWLTMTNQYSGMSCNKVSFVTAQFLQHFRKSLWPFRMRHCWNFTDIVTYIFIAPEERLEDSPFLWNGNVSCLICPGHNALLLSYCFWTRQSNFISKR